MPRSWGKDIGGVLQEIGTDGRSFWGKPWLIVGYCANYDDDDDDDATGSCKYHHQKAL